MTEPAPRRELPTDPHDLEPMGELFDAALEAGLTELGLLEARAATPLARRSYEAHARLLRDWNKAINLTAIRDPEGMAVRHVCDSLSAVPHLEPLVKPGMSLLEIVDADDLTPIQVVQGMCLIALAVRIGEIFEKAGRSDLRRQVHQAPISTIHAFCRRLLAEHALVIARRQSLSDAELAGLTVAVVAPLFSLIEEATIVSVSAADSSSVTSMVSLPSAWAAADAVIVTFCVPSTMASSPRPA